MQATDLTPQRPAHRSQVSQRRDDEVKDADKDTGARYCPGGQGCEAKRHGTHCLFAQPARPVCLTGLGERKRALPALSPSSPPHSTASVNHQYTQLRSDKAVSGRSVGGTSDEMQWVRESEWPSPHHATTHQPVSSASHVRERHATRKETPTGKCQNRHANGAREDREVKD